MNKNPTDLPRADTAEEKEEKVDERVDRREICILSFRRLHAIRYMFAWT